MKQWFRVDKATNRIKGWHRSSNATVVPPDTVGVTHVECTDAQIQELSDKEAEMRQIGQPPVVKLEGGVLIKETDSRPVVRVTSSLSEVQVGDPVTITIEVLDGIGGNVRTNFNATRKIELFGRRFKLDFVNGVAQKTWTPRESVLLEWHSDGQVRLESSPFTLDVVE